MKKRLRKVEVVRSQLLFFFKQCDRKPESLFSPSWIQLNLDMSFCSSICRCLQFVLVRFSIDT